MMPNWPGPNYETQAYAIRGVGFMSTGQKLLRATGG